MWDLTVSVPDHCLSFYFVPLIPQSKNSNSLMKNPAAFAPHPSSIHWLVKSA